MYIPSLFFFVFLGVPMEVMGLMLGEFVDEYTVRVIDVFAMPQSGTGVSVEAVDPVFQAKMLDMLKQTGEFTLNIFGKIGTWVLDKANWVNKTCLLNLKHPHQNLKNRRVSEKQKRCPISRDVIHFFLYDMQ